MTVAQPQPMPVPLEGGINEEAALTTVSQPVVIENARYARSGSLSKRNGYAIDTAAPLPSTPYSAPNHEFVAFDGDKFVARKTPTGLTFYQRRGTIGALFGHAEQRELHAATQTSAGQASRLRPRLTPLPAMQAPTPAEGLLADLCIPEEFLGARYGKVLVYVRLEQTDYRASTLGTSYLDWFDIVIEYLDVEDTRLSVREPSRLRNAIAYNHTGATRTTHRQIRVMNRGLDVTTDLVLVYTDDTEFGDEPAIRARRLSVGATAAADVWGPANLILFGGSLSDQRPNLKPEGPGFDCDPFLPSSSPIAFSVLYASPYGVAWAKVTNLDPVSVTIHVILYPDPFFAMTVPSVAISGLQNGATQEVVWAAVIYDTGSGAAKSAVGRFNATISGAPSTISGAALDGLSSPGKAVKSHTAIAGRFKYGPTGALVDAYLAGINTGEYGFQYRLGEKGVTALYDNVHAISCAWATGRPHTIFQSYMGRDDNVVRVVLPMVSFGGVQGGGAGVLADMTPRVNFGTPGQIQNGAPLLTTYAIDQVSLSTTTISSFTNFSGPGSGPIRTADWNSGLYLKPCHGGDICYNQPCSPRWLDALGSPPTAVLLSFAQNDTDFEFLEPGVMLQGPGVPIMLDTVHGVSELGFHTSPPVLLASGFTVTAGQGYAEGVILQYRFQYRFVDGLGRSQVSPPTDPFQMTSTFSDLGFSFTLSTLDVTLRHLGAVVIDVYRTEDRQATFYYAGSVSAEGGNMRASFTDAGPTKTVLDKTRTVNDANFFMTPPCANTAFRGAFRDVVVTRENELWPSKRRLSTTAPQFDIIDAAAWDATEPVITGGEIDGKLVLLSRSRIAYTYELNGVLAPFVDIPSDAGAVDGSRAFSTHLGIFYQAPVGIRIVGRDLALHEVGMPLLPRLRSAVIRGGIKVPRQGEIRLRLNDGRTYLVFDYLHGDPDHPVWYVTAFNEQGSYEDEDGTVHPVGLRAIADQAFAPDGRLLYLCRLGFLLEETPLRHRDENQWVRMRVRSGPMRAATALSYLATIESAVNLELPPGREPGPVTLRLYGDYEDSVPLQPTVERAWTIAEIEAFDRRQLQVTSGERVMNAPAVTVEYSDANPGNVDAVNDGFGYRLSSVVMVYGPRDQKTIFPVANGARK